MSPVFPSGSAQQLSPLPTLLPLLYLGESLELTEAKHVIFSRTGRKGVRLATESARTSSERHISCTAAGSQGVISDCLSVYSKIWIKFCGIEYSNLGLSVNLLLGFEPVVHLHLGRYLAWS